VAETSTRSRPFEPRHVLGDRQLGDLLDQPFQDAPPDLRVGDIPSAEEDRRLDLVALGQEALDVLLLEVVVVLVHFGTELDFLDLDRLLVLPRLTGPLLLVVLIAAVVGDATHRRHGRGRDLHEIESLGARDANGVLRGHDAQLGAGFVDDAHFADADSVVDPHPIVPARRPASVECDNYLPLCCTSRLASSTN